MAGVTAEKRGNHWRYRFEIAKQDGKRSRMSKGGFETKKDALAAGVKALAKYNRAGIVFVPSEISFNDYIDLWMKEYAEKNLKPETIVNYRKRIRAHLKPKLGKYKLKAITPLVLQELLNEKFNDGYSRNTLTTIKTILSGSFRYAVIPLGFIEQSPMNNVRLPSPRAKAEIPTRSAPHIYIPSERMQEIFKRFPEGASAHIPMQFGYRCGMRIGEAFGLMWSDVDFESKKLSIQRQIQWDTQQHAWYFTEPKYDSARTIDIDDELLALLSREYERQQKAQVYYEDRYIKLFEDEKRYINTQGNGKQIDLITVRENGSHIAPRIMQHASAIIHQQLRFPEFDFHSLRHTHITMLIDNDAPLKYVQERVGHRKVEVTINVYQHISEVAERRGIKTLNDMLIAK